MKKQNYKKIDDIEKRYEKRDKRKKRKMKVSGAKAKDLQKIILIKN